MSRARLFGNALRFALLTGVAVAAACSDDPGGGDSDSGDGAAGDGSSTGAQPSGGTAGTDTGGTSAGGEPGGGGTMSGGSAGTASGTGGEGGGDGDAGEGGESAKGGASGAAGSSAGMAGGGAGGAGGSTAGAGMAGGGMSGSGNAGGGAGGSGNVGGAGMAGGGSGNAGGGAGGAGGSGGSGTIGCGSPSIVDDMEDGDGGICWSSTRIGGWYVGKQAGVGSIFPDVGTVVTPSVLVPQRGTSTRGMHFQGSGFAGADHWAYLATSVFAGTEGVAYNASVHTGIRFWARSDAGAVVINVKFNAVSTTNTSVGGSCVPTTLPCDDHWQVARTLSGAWQQYSINFQTDLSQAGWGVARPKDLAHLRAIEFYYSSNGNPAAFDYWVDDIEFW